MGYKLPWSNFHELNLDWLLEEVKKLREDVDGISGSSTPSDTPPLMDGVADPGTSVSYARGDHVHPTDTTRAADTDLAQEILDRDLADQGLAADISAVDGKIHFSSAAPLMDGVANPGSSTDQARADHVHPTDTSRASKSEFDTLKATVDGMSGSASPYDVNPLMDGVASYGTVGAYSRGDHVHPSDTSKLDTAGGTISGDLTVDGNFYETKLHTEDELDNTGWYRVATVPNVAGTCIWLHIQRKGTTSEAHDVILTINSNGVAFATDHSSSSQQIIDKVRYSNIGAVDIHLDQNETSDVMITIDKYAATEAARDAITTIPIVSVNEAPAGETILTTYTIVQAGTDPFAMELLTDITSFTLVSLTGSVTGYVRMTTNADHSIFQFGARINLNISTRTGPNGGASFDLPFTYKGPTMDIEAGWQSQHSNEVVYAQFTNGSPTVTIRTSESYASISTGQVRFGIPTITIFNN